MSGTQKLHVQIDTQQISCVCYLKTGNCSLLYNEFWAGCGAPGIVAAPGICVCVCVGGGGSAILREQKSKNLPKMAIPLTAGNLGRASDWGGGGKCHHAPLRCRHYSGSIQHEVQPRLPTCLWINFEMKADSDELSLELAICKRLARGWPRGQLYLKLDIILVKKKKKKKIT